MHPVYFCFRVNIPHPPPPRPASLNDARAHMSGPRLRFRLERFSFTSMAFVNVKCGERQVKLRESSLNARNLALVFKLQANTIYLSSDDGELVLADETGSFIVNPAVNYNLHGDAEVPTTRTAPNTFSYQPAQAFLRSRLNPPPRPTFTATNGPNTTHNKKSWKKAFIYVDIDGDRKVTEKCQLHLPLSEETAQLSLIKNKLKDQIGADVEVLDSKYLPIVDSELTKGNLLMCKFLLLHLILATLAQIF